MPPTTPSTEAGTVVGDTPDQTRDDHALRRILLATDLSARSDRALESAVVLARRLGAQLSILHVVDEDLPAAAMDTVIRAARTEIEASLAKTGTRGTEAALIDVVPGKDYRDILEYAEEARADLIVAGIHRNEDGAKPIAGTTMERVIRKGVRPVLVVPGRVQADYRRVLLGVDFSAFSRFAIRAALAIAPEAEIQAVHAFEVPFSGFQGGSETRRQYRRRHEDELSAIIAEELGVLIGSSAGGFASSIQPVVRHGGVESVLRAEVERFEPELLVLGTHGRVGLAHVFLGSVAEGFLTRPPCDVLVVKAW